MNGNTRWLGWLGIGVGVVALLVALSGRGFAPQSAAGFGGSAMPQAYAQQGRGFQGDSTQSGQGAPGANNAPGARQQNAGPQAQGQPNAGPQAQGQPNARPQAQGQPWADGRGGSRRHDGGGFGFGGWLSFPARLAGSLARWGALAVAVLAGLWFLRGRGGASNRPAPAHGPASEPLSPTGEAYTEEPSDSE